MCRVVPCRVWRWQYKEWRKSSLPHRRDTGSACPGRGYRCRVKHTVVRRFTAKLEGAFCSIVSGLGMLSNHTNSRIVYSMPAYSTIGVLSSVSSRASLPSGGARNDDNNNAHAIASKIILVLHVDLFYTVYRKLGWRSVNIKTDRYMIFYYRISRICLYV